MLLRYSPCTGGGLPAPPPARSVALRTLQPLPCIILTACRKYSEGGLQGQKSMAQWLVGGGAARSVRTLQEGGAGSPPHVQGEYLNSTFDFLDDVLIFEKILQGPERYRIGTPCKVRIATKSAKPARSRARRYRIRNCSSPHGKWELCILSLPTYETEQTKSYKSYRVNWVNWVISLKETKLNSK